MHHHLQSCIESIKFEDIQDGIRLQNFKRRIEENPSGVIRDVKKQYRRHYKASLSSALTWRMDKDRVYLFDNECQQARLVYEPGLKPLLVPPIGCKKIVRYNYAASAAPINLPKLPKDALRSIFKFIPGWELLTLRLVCKQWNRVLRTTPTLWTLRISRCPDEWVYLTAMESYIQHMFLNVRDTRQIYRFFLKRPKFFIYICGLMVGHHSRPTAVVQKSQIEMGGYTLTMSGLLFNGVTVNIERFLDAYRQSILPN